MELFLQPLPLFQKKTDLRQNKHFLACIQVGDIQWPLSWPFVVQYPYRKTKSPCFGLFGPRNTGKSLFLAKLLQNSVPKSYQHTTDVFFYQSPKDIIYIDTPGWDYPISNFELEVTPSEDQQIMTHRLQQWLTLRLIDCAIVFLRNISLEEIRNINWMYNYLKRTNPSALIFVVCNSFNSENRKDFLLLKILCPEIRSCEIGEIDELQTTGIIQIPVEWTIEERVETACRQLSSWLGCQLHLTDQKILCSGLSTELDIDIMPAKSNPYASYRIQKEQGFAYITIELPGAIDPSWQILATGITIEAEKISLTFPCPLASTINEQDYDIFIPVKIAKVLHNSFSNGVLILQCQIN